MTAALLALGLSAFGAPAGGRSSREAALALADSLAARVERLARSGRPAAPELLESARSAWAIRARERGPDDPLTLASLERLARVHQGRVEVVIADSLMELVVAARARARPADPHATLVSVAGLAESRRNAKRLASAASLADSALGLLKRDARPDTSLECRLRTTLGNVLAEQGQLERSRDELALALRLADSCSRPDSADLATALYGLGRTLSLIGDARGSLAALDRAAAIEEHRLGPESPEVASILLLAANPLAAEGDYVTQRRYAERAMAIRERAFGPSHPNLAPVLWALAHAEADLGDPWTAQRHYQRAVDILRESPNAIPANLAVALNNLGSNCLRLGDGAAALVNLREAKAIRERLFGPGRGAGFWAETRIAHAMLMSGDAAGAARALDDLLAASGSRTPEEIVDASFMRGSARRALGQLGAAYRDFDRAFVLGDSLYGSASPATLAELALRAIVSQQLGNRDAAFDDALRAESASREAIRHVARGLSEREALGYERLRGSGLDVLVSLATDSIGLDPVGRAKVLDAVIQSRLVVLDELADERIVRPRGGAEIRELHRRVEEARDAYASAMVAALRESRAPDSVVTAARERRERAERELAERSEPFRDALNRSAADLGAVAAAIPEGGALVSYIRHVVPADIPDGGESDFVPRIRRARYAAIVLRAGARVPEIVDLGSVADIEQRVERWVRACATPPPAGQAAADASVRRCDALGRSVRAAVWGPLERAILGATTVFVVPDGALHAINFLALPDSRGGYLAERGPLVHRLTAERDLLPWGEGSVGARGLVAFGGVDFDRTGDPAPALLASSEAGAERRVASPDTLHVHFAPLPATALEADAIAGAWRRCSSLADAAVVTERTGGAASEAEFRRLAPGCRVLHVATHGFALGTEPAGRAPEGTRSVGGVGTRPPIESMRRPAALLPGLALAGANRPAVRGDDDGFLTAEEITSLDLSGVEWAVLSACQSGLSDPTAVEAVQGLHRAFRRAGARTVIMSLWLVDDTATRDWMGRLYDARLAHGMSTAASVRSASRGWLAERRARGLDTHPFYWAAFVATGDWH